MDGLMAELDKYMAFASIFGEQSIVRDSPVAEAAAWAAWRDAIVQMHSDGELPHDIVAQFKSRTKFLGD